ncbi:CoA transferase [Deltaproteobacteria bacterium]|nr:CoA transferase [Deltaproteobacteria bacterium]
MRPIRVADFTRVLAGPWAAQTLGDQGFDVIKVESLDGDETRRFAPLREGVSVYFACTNRNKRSLALNLKHPGGREVALRLIGDADVVLENFRPGVMDRLGLGYAAVGRPEHIWVSISAFGADIDGAGYDLVLQSIGAITTLTGDPPQKAGPSIADLASAQIAVQGVLFGLLDRARTGKGRRVDISMLDVQHSLLAYYASASLNAGAEPPPPSNAHPSIAPYNLYRCRDGWLSICCANEALWLRLQRALALPDDPAWRTLASRIQHRAALDEAINVRLADGDVATWEASLGAAGVPVGAALTVPQSLAHPHAHQFTLGTWTQPMPPLGLVSHRPPPGLGEHTEEVLGELGYTEEEREGLRAMGATG